VPALVAHDLNRYAKEFHIPLYNMIVWILTIVLAGTTISFTDPKPFVSLKDCKDEGFRQVRDYQEGNIKAQWECEEVAVNTPAGNESASSIARH
jgi:hypothetical protein